MAKVLYIASQGHSGSTLLDLLCGTIPGVFSMGEMHFFSWQLYQGELPDDPQNYCSCGSYFDKCPFWSAIIEEINNERNIDICKHPEEFDTSINRGIIREKRYFGHMVLNKLYTLGIRNNVFSALKYPIYQIYKNSVRNTWDLYDKVGEKSGCDYVIDSSKNIIRYLFLKKMRPHDIKLIILKRDIKGVASSSHHGLSDELVRGRGKSWVRYYKQLIPSLLTRFSKDEYKQISYEDICNRYNDLRRELASFLELSDDFPDIQVISPYKYHTVQGNPMRLKKTDLKIKYDERWREKLTEEQIEWLNNLAK